MGFTQSMVIINTLVGPLVLFQISKKGELKVKNKSMSILCCLVILIGFLLPADAKRKCLGFNSLFSAVQNNYTGTIKFANQTHVYQIDLVTRPDALGFFNYNVSVVGLNGTPIQIATNFQGFVSYESIVLPLPGASTCLANSNAVLPSGALICIAVLDKRNSQLQGTCTQLFSVGDVIGSIQAGSSMAQLTLLPK